jgi:D-sedoheptulose 7-phosphate isomerase
MAARFAAGGRLFSFGNGGSSTDADAVAELFMFPRPGPRRLPARSLTADVATLTALANDVSFDVVFARPLAADGRAGDIALGLSTSGSSANVLAGFAQAHRIGMLTVGLAGYSGGAMAEARDRGEIEHLFVMPSDSVHRIQEAQTTTYQVLWELVHLALGS